MNMHDRPFKKKFMKLSSAFSTAVAGMLLFAGIASAHVTVSPSVSQPEAWETYTIKVPVEKDVATTKVALKIPEGVEFKQYEPVPGWKVSTTADDAGAVKTVTWTAEGEGILAGQYQRFSFVAVNPSAETKVAWDAFQYYKDGSIVEWTGDEGSDLPHSVTTVTADPAAAEKQSGDSDAKTGHDGAPGSAGTNEGEQTGADKSAASSQAAPAAEAAPASSGVQTATLVISIAALVLSVAALLRALKNRR